MAQFKFAFESLKKLRSNRLLVARKEMLSVEGKLRDAVNEHQGATMSRVHLFDSRDGGALSAGELNLTMELISTQTQKLSQLEKKILTVQGELERHRNWVAHLGKELKIVEKLEENQRTAFVEKERFQEKRAADRWVAERWAAKMNQSEETSS